MAFDTNAYIHALVATHGLVAKPGDTDGSELTHRAVHAELADIKQRAQNLHDWSAAVIACRETRTGPARRAAHRPSDRRAQAHRC
ncbi:hypothetical protein [Catenulispora rubra]|uniref:hypothetical protein n=1 Tax=Catenulispora rubra TaxID=280293 RepID=UPI0018924B0C|nr:hypothetical protein [Catenulispora rubra]